MTRSDSEDGIEFNGLDSIAALEMRRTTTTASELEQEFERTRESLVSAHTESTFIPALTLVALLISWGIIVAQLASLVGIHLTSPIWLYAVTCGTVAGYYPLVAIGDRLVTRLL